MARRSYTTSFVCAHEGCTERGFYEFDTRREQREGMQRMRDRPWRCVRHTRPNEVLTAENVAQKHVLVSYETDFGYGPPTHRFWAPEGQTKGGNGFCHGPGFKAFAEDFPAGTRLIVTARVELPDTPSSEDPR